MASHSKAAQTRNQQTLFQEAVAHRQLQGSSGSLSVAAWDGMIEHLWPTTTVTLTLPNGKTRRPVTSFQNASDLFRETIERWDLGSSDLGRHAGEIIEGGVVVAHVSYNGRIWYGPATGEIGKEIVLS